MYFLKKGSLPRSVQCHTLALFAFLIAFLSQNMGKECTRGCNTGEFHILCKMIENKQVESLNWGSQAIQAGLPLVLPSHPFCRAPHSLYHPVKPSNVDQMQKSILTDLLALPKKLHPHMILLRSSPCFSHLASHEVMV